MMELTSKQRAKLSGLANGLDAIFWVGKNSLSPEMISAIDDALRARELIKVSVQKNCMDDPRELGEIIAGRTQSILVRTIGRIIILFRPAKDPKDSKYLDKL